jgi:branched-chain amino acid transport system substrate-binding protein
MLLAGAAVALLAGPAAAAPREATRGVTVGALLDLSAGWTSLGRASRVTLQLANVDTNAALARGGSTYRTRLIIADAGDDVSRWSRQLRRLAGRGARVIIGPQRSSEVAALREEAKKLGVLLVSQGSTAHSLAFARDNVFRLVPDDVREAEALDALLAQDGITAIAPIWREDPGNAGLGASVRTQARNRNATVSSGVPYAADNPDFAAAVAALRQQVDSLRTSAGDGHVGVYLAAFDEVVDLFRIAQADPVLSSVRWYGSDGVALTRALIEDGTAAAFANRVGYPNPISGLDATASEQAGSVVRRATARLRSTPDAFALAAYDGYRIAVAATIAAQGRSTAFLRKEFAQRANGYRGVSGRIVLNPAGDRAFGTYDFWSVCNQAGKAVWTRTASYISTELGVGKIVKRRSCGALQGRLPIASQVLEIPAEGAHPRLPAKPSNKSAGWYRLLAKRAPL